MKNIFINFIDRLEQIRESKPRLFKILFYTLWAIAPIEMCCIKLGIFGYKKLKKKFYFNSTLEDLK